MNKVLLPTDFSENSANAIHYALDLFSGTKATFYVLNVQKASSYATDDLLIASPGTSVYEAIVADNKAKLEQFFEPIKAEYAEEDFSFELSVDFDTLTDAINQAVKRFDIDLIIMGSNGATGAAEVLFGSNTLKTIRQVDHPLLIIPEDYRFQGINDILFTLHQDEEMDEDPTEILRRLRERFDARLTLLEILETEPNQLTGNVEQEADRYCRLKGIPFSMAISAFVQLNPVDLNVLFARKEMLLKRFFKGSEANRVSYGTQVPLLILHHA